MKLGTFILAALCAATPAHADHLAVIEHYQRAYGETPDPHLLTMIGNEYRDAGKPAEALAYYCSYIFIAPAGDDADYASQQVHALVPRAESDHDACTRTKPVTAPQSVDVLATMPELPPRISGREIIGISAMVLALGSFGFALYEGKQADKYNAEIAGIDPSLPRTAHLDSLEAKANANLDRQKWLLAGGGAMLVTGGILYMIGRYERLKAAAMVVGTSVSKHGAGVVLGGKF